MPFAGALVVSSLASHPPIEAASPGRRNRRSRPTPRRVGARARSLRLSSGRATRRRGACRHGPRRPRREPGRPVDLQVHAARAGRGLADQRDQDLQPGRRGLGRALRLARRSTRPDHRADRLGARRGALAARQGGQARARVAAQPRVDGDRRARGPELRRRHPLADPDRADHRGRGRERLALDPGRRQRARASARGHGHRLPARLGPSLVPAPRRAGESAHARQVRLLQRRRSGASSRHRVARQPLRSSAALARPLARAAGQVALGAGRGHLLRAARRGRRSSQVAARARARTAASAGQAQAGQAGHDEPAESTRALPAARALAAAAWTAQHREHATRARRRRAADQQARLDPWPLGARRAREPDWEWRLLRACRPRCALGRARAQRSSRGVLRRPRRPIQHAHRGR